jgi:hypothetical protein
MKRIKQLELEARDQIQYHFMKHMKQAQMVLWPYFILTVILLLIGGLFTQIILLLLLGSLYLAVKNIRLAIKEIETLENLIWSHKEKANDV